MFKNQLLNYFITRYSQKIEQKYRVKFNIQKATLHGVSSISLENISLIPFQKDTLFYCQELQVSFEVFPLLWGKLNTNKTNIRNTKLQLIKNEHGDNFSMFLTNNAKQENKNTTLNYNKITNRLCDAFFRYIPTELKGENINLITIFNEHKINTAIPLITINNNNLQGNIAIHENNTTYNIQAIGEINKKKKALTCNITTTDSAKTNIPALEKYFNIKAGFQEIQFAFQQSSNSFFESEYEGISSINHFYIHHEKIAPKEINIEHLQFNYKFKIGTTFIELDSTSSFELKDWKTNVYVKYQNDTSKTLAIDIKAPWCNAQQMFNALPHGLFYNLDNMKVTGELAYQLHFYIDIDHPNLIELSSSMPRKGFKILAYGNTNFNDINNDFLLPVYQNNQLQRVLAVSASNPYFTNYENLPQKVVASVLTAEDGSFMYNSGLNIDAFRKSITDNVKAKRFKRGGSTITMQLVKNVYLNKNKTISRKLEEMLIVWLLETQHIVSKQRLLEIYFNVIEWGPNVYGIAEAAEFYFQKKPQELTWDEAIYLASIVPSPKKFMRNFDTEGNLKNKGGYYRLLSNIMVRRNQMLQVEKDSLKANVHLNGIAKQYLNHVIKADTTTTLQEEEINEPSLNDLQVQP